MEQARGFGSAGTRARWMLILAGAVALGGASASVGGCNQILGNSAPEGSGGDSSLGGANGAGGSLPVTLDAKCVTSGARACDHKDAKLALVCSKGTWQSSGSCSAGENCDPAAGVCADIVPECRNRDEGGRYCDEDDRIVACGPNLVSSEVGEACAGRCQQVDGSARCVPVTCGDGRKQEGEDCDDGNDDNDDACTELCRPPYCSDGLIAAGEECDDGGESDSCDDDCTAVMCGDGNVNDAAGEACDDGGASDSCDDDCTAVVCGDDKINAAAGEECDDGNADDSDGCTDCLRTPYCGDEATNTERGEACDDGGESATCDEDCTTPMCGDGVVNASFAIEPFHASDTAATEQCDPDTSPTDDPQRATNNSAACDRDCTFARCGDAFENAVAGEQCDDVFVESGPKPATDVCNADCTSAACGDGKANAAFIVDLYGTPDTLIGKECDPGTGTTGNSRRAAADSATCDSDCSAVRCGDGRRNQAAGEDCDNVYVASGPPAATATCDTDCTFAACGDGIVNPAFAIQLMHDGSVAPAEQCDPGTGTTSDGKRAMDDSHVCDRDCSTARCGDGYVNVAAGEECDDVFIGVGSKPATEACNADCTLAD